MVPAEFLLHFLKSKSIGLMILENSKNVTLSLKMKFGNPFTLVGSYYKKFNENVTYILLGRLNLNDVL